MRCSVFFLSEFFVCCLCIFQFKVAFKAQSNNTHPLTRAAQKVYIFIYFFRKEVYACV